MDITTSEPAETKDDGTLIRDVVESGSQASFQQLVERHSAMVLGVCGRQLGEGQDAEDAAQAVFVVLWKKAADLRKRNSIAGWLHRVARYVCMDARKAQRIRQQREREAAQMSDQNECDQTWSEIQEYLDDELNRLPEKYRLPIILFHLEGRSQEEIAVLLHTKRATVATRLSRGREILRSRLVRRGVTVSVTALVSILTTETCSAAVPSGFVTATTGAATLFAAGKLAAGGALTAQTAALSNGAINMLLIAKIKTAAAVVVTATILAGGGAAVVQHVAQAEQKQPTGGAAAKSFADGPTLPALAKTPFDASSLPAANEDRYAGGLINRVYLGQKLTEQGDSDRGNRHLRAVERRLDEMKDGFVFLSGKRVDDAKLALARDDRGYVFGIRRQGSPGKSYTLSALARFYADNGDLEQAKALIRRIPSDSEQLQAAERLVIKLVKAGQFAEAAAYRSEVLKDLDWNAEAIADIPRLYTSQNYRFVSNTAFFMLDAYDKAGMKREADKLASSMCGWLDVINDSDKNPDIASYRALSTTLIRYYIDTGRQARARHIAEAGKKKWRDASLPDEQAILRPSLERNRKQQLAVYELIVKQPPGGAFPLTSGNLTRLPETIPARFVEIENLEASDPQAARLKYIALGQEINADERRCKRYLKPVIDALIRLGDEPAAIELAGELQENLPQEKIKGCPILAFQGTLLRYVEGLNLKPLLTSIAIQESKLTSIARLRIGGVDTARAYAKAGDLEAALRVVDKCSEAATPENFNLMRSIIRFRHETFGEIRDDEVRRLIKYAQTDTGRRTSTQVRLSTAARLFVDIGRYNWAEAIIDALSPESRSEPASEDARNTS